jgi:hypothetical protein
MRSTMSLLAPYGLIGRWGWASVIGVVSGIPYVAQVEENTSIRTPPSTRAPRSRTVAATLLSWY